MDPKHVLMRLGLLYLKDHGDRTSIRKSLLNETELRKEIAKVKVVERPELHNDFVWIWTELHK